MKISASLYSNKDRQLLDLARELDQCHIDLFHIDCNDDPSVFEDIKRIRSVSKTPIDIHIISEKPEQYFGVLAELQLEYVTFQYEQLPKEFTFPVSSCPSTKFGLAITTDTSIEVFEAYKTICDFILIMTTIPGQSGGKFKKENFQKIRRFRNSYPGIKIHVDGGVNDETGFILRMLGVHSVVSGSYLVKNQSIPLSLLHLRSSIIHSEFKVKDFLIDREFSPVLNIEQADFKTTLQAIEEYDLGFVCFTDSQSNFKGICSNADVRKGLLAHFENLSSADLKKFLNTSPVTIHEDSTISEMLNLIQSKSFLISFLPVVDSENKLKGTLTFFNLIRSES